MACYLVLLLQLLFYFAALEICFSVFHISLQFRVEVFFRLIEDPFGVSFTRSPCCALLHFKEYLDTLELKSGAIFHAST